MRDGLVACLDLRQKLKPVCLCETKILASPFHGSLIHRDMIFLVVIVWKFTTKHKVRNLNNTALPKKIKVSFTLLANSCPQ